MAKTHSLVRWIVCGPTFREFAVVRITTTEEHLAGPFKTLRQAQKWIVSNQTQAAPHSESPGG